MFGLLIILLLVKDSILDFLIFLEELIVGLIVNTVGGMASLLLWFVSVHLLRCIRRVAYFFDGKFNAADLKDVFLLDFVVLNKG